MVSIRAMIIHQMAISLRMYVLDQYQKTESYYECTVCQERAVSNDHVGRCPDCGGTMRNLAVARE
ncbi:rubrerythrin-like domain-containing protein [Halalkalicoccus salilacus]|uniref:rubrerythrin-like domain-containing protein n=1 Tax=Halalkalicoccus sp. GCM10025704 TaxID=3252662 RepID=UPI0036103B4B